MKICQRSWRFCRDSGSRSQLNRGHAPTADAAPRFLRPARVSAMTADAPTHPDRHRHRRHVHRRRRLRRGHRRARHHQDPVHPGRPGRRLHRPASHKVLDLLGADRRRRHRGQPRHHRRHQPAARGQGRAASASSPPRATSSCSRSPARRARRLRQLLLLGEAAAHRPAPTGSRPSAAGSTSTGDEVRPVRRGRAPSPRPAGSATTGITTIGVCFLHSYANADPRAADARRSCAASTPRRSCRSRSEVLREYREYERVDDHAGRRRRQAAASPRTSPTSTSRLDGFTGEPADPVLRDEVQRRRALGRRGRAPADHHGAVRAGGRRARRRADRRGGRLRPGAHLRRRRHLDRRHAWSLDGEPALTTEGTVGAYPCKIPMIDVVTVGAGGGSIAWISPEGTLKVGPQSAGADPGPICYGQGRHRADDHRRPRRARPDPAAPARRRDPARRRRRPRRASTRSPAELGLDARARAPPASSRSRAWNQANALRQVTRQARPRRARLHAGHVRRLRARCSPAGWSTSSASPASLVPPEPGQRVGVRPADRRRQERLRADRRRPARAARPRRRRRRRSTSSTGRAADGARRARASPRERARASCAPPTCATSARPSRCA